MVPSGKNHSPMFPPSLVLQHLELTLVVTQTRENPASETSTNSPISVMNTVSPGRYVTPFNRKNSPVLPPVASSVVGKAVVSSVVGKAVISSVVGNAVVSSVVGEAVVSSAVGEAVVSSVVGEAVVSSVVGKAVASSLVGKAMVGRGVIFLVVGRTASNNFHNHEDVQ